MRLAAVHQHLARELKLYADECSIPLPTKHVALPPPKDAKLCDVDVITKTYAGNMMVPVEPPAAPEVATEKEGSRVKSSMAPPENDINVQWYLPALDEFSSAQKVKVALGGHVRDLLAV